MKPEEALRRLEASGSAQTRKTYARHGVRGPLFGVSYAGLAKLEKEIGKDQALAEALWKSGNHDARVLATKIADPARMTRRLLEAWSKDLQDYVLTHAFAELAAATAAAKELAGEWASSEKEWLGSAGWTIIAVLAEGDAFDGDELARRVREIERGIHDSPNRTRYAMNQALISIGAYRQELRGAALAAAKRIGPVEVDHGDTDCKTPDAAVYIEKIARHRAKRAPPKRRPPARKRTRAK